MGGGVDSKQEGKHNQACDEGGHHFALLTCLVVTGSLHMFSINCNEVCNEVSKEASL